LHDLRLDHDVAQRAALDTGQDRQLGSAGADADLQDAVGLGDGELACPGQPLRKELADRDRAPARLHDDELDEITLHNGLAPDPATAAPSEAHRTRSGLTWPDSPA